MTAIYQVSNYTPCQIGLVKGERGENGANGANGLNGKDGKDGKDGLRGLSGSDGKSLYQIALDNGFVGTFDDYQETLKGDDNYQLAVKAGFDGDYDAWVALTTANIGDAAVNSILGGFVTIDSFELGATITQRNQALRHAVDGKLYRWAGDLPKTVPVGSTPTTSGGFGFNAWLEVSDVTLRQDLTNPDNGAAMVGRGVLAVDSIADLLALPEGQRKEDLRYLVKGYHAGSDAGGGEFYYDPSRVSENDGGSVLDGFVREISGPIDIACFGALGNDASNDTQPFKLAFGYLQTYGGSLDLRGRIYRVSCVIDEDLLTLNGARGISILSNGAIIRDTTLYAKDPEVQTATLLRIDYVDGFIVSPDLTIESTVVYDGISSSARSEGLSAIVIGKGCRNININLVGNDIRSAVRVSGDAGDSGEDRTVGIKVRAKVRNARHGFVAAWNGDSADIEIESDNVGRVFFIYGVDDYKIKVRGRNSVTSLIKSYGVGDIGSPEAIGYGCSNIEVWFHEQGGDSYKNAAPLIAVEFGDGRPATMRNIKLHMDTIEPQDSNWGNTITVNKYGPNNTTPDSVGRGHVLDGLEVSGYMSKGANAHMVMGAGTFAAPDSVKGIHIHDLALKGGRPLSARFGDTSAVKFTNVVSEGNVYSNSPEGDVFIACEARNFTASTSGADRHDYISCKITSGDLQNYDQNKTFINTVTPLGTLNSVSDRAQSLGWSSKATTRLVGDLTQAVNVFRLPPSTGGLVRIRYQLTFAPNDYSPSSRREVTGVKTLTLAVNSAGSPAIQLPVEDEIPERVLGTNPAEVTIGAVAGDASNGAYITFSATNYDQSNSRAFLELDLLGGPAVYPSRVYPV